MLPLFSIAGAGYFSTSLISASASFLSLADIFLSAWIWASCALSTASVPTYFLVAGSKPPSTRLMLSTTLLYSSKLAKPLFLAIASSCAVILLSGLASCGIFAVIGSISLVAASALSICFSVSAICLTWGACCGGAACAGAIWLAGACLACASAALLDSAVSETERQATLNATKRGRTVSRMAVSSFGAGFELLGGRITEIQMNRE